MYTINEDLSIYATRGDIVAFSVAAEDDGKGYVFQPGDVVRIKVYGKKDAESVVLQKDFPVLEATEQVEIFLSEQDTKIGEVISKPKDYWYEVELNPFTNPQTIIGYDEDGAKVFKLFPEGDDIPPYEPAPEDLKKIDDELDMTSTRPVQNQAIARAVVSLEAAYNETKKAITEKADNTHKKVEEIESEVGVERARLDNLISHNVVNLSKSLDYLEAITETTKAKIDGKIDSDGAFATITVNWREANQVYGGTTLDMFIIPNECRPMEIGLVHTEDGIEYRISYDGSRYYMSFTVQSDITVAPSGAGTVTMSYALGDYELKDIRVGADGYTHGSAGTAIRVQFHEKANKLYLKKQVACDLVEGTVCNVDTKETLTASRGNHIVYVLQGETRLSVSGYSWANSEHYPFVAFLDASGNVLERYGEVNTAYFNVEFRVPTDAASVICNGETDSVASILDMYEERDVEAELNSLEIGVTNLDNHKMEKLYGETAVDYEVVEGEVYNITDNSGLTAPEGNYATYKLQGESELLVSGYSWVSNSKFPLYAFYDADGEVIEIYGESNVAYKGVLVEVPNNAAKIFVNGIAHTPATIKKRVERNIATMLNHWYGKKIVFLGTSVTHGALAETSYAFEAAEKLGFDLVNTAKPGMAITVNADGTMRTYGSSTLTKAEYEAQGRAIESEMPEGYDTPNATCNDFYMTWENIFSEKNADADLWVFDVVPNNGDFSLTDYDNFDKTNWVYKDGSDFAEHRSTFLGAVIYLMDKLYELNPYARIAFVVGSGIALSSAAKRCLETLKTDWNIAVINLWGKVNTSPKSYEKLHGDDAHPSTFAHEIMGNMLAHELLLIN